jgi:protein SCO1/2
MRMRHTVTKRALAAIAALLLATGMAAASAADDHSKHMQHGQHGKNELAPGKVQIQLPDTVLTDQNGKAVRFKADAMADRLVAINFVYTTCTTVCPVQSALMADLQQRLGEHAGRDVSLISVSVDPLRDTPLRLKEFAARYKAGPGWRFLTGSRQAVDEVLKAFGVYTPNFADHPAAVLVGDPQTGVWVRYFGFPSTDQLLGRVKELQAGRQGVRSARAN